jgi:hypothetical protein
MTCESLKATTFTDIFVSHLLVCALTFVGCLLVVLGAFLHIYLRDFLDIHHHVKYQHICRSLFYVTLLCYAAFLFLGSNPCLWSVLIPFFILRGGMAIVIAQETAGNFVFSEGMACLLVLSLFLLFGVVSPHLYGFWLLPYKSAPSWMYFLESQSSMLVYFALYVLVVELHWNINRSKLYLLLTLFLIVGLVLWHLYIKNTPCYKEPPLTGTVLRFVTLITLLADTSRLW